MKGSQMFDALSSAAVAYAKANGSYNSRQAALRRIYKGKPGYETDFDAKLQEELVADIIGDRLFTDEDFIRQLATEDRNLFQKIFDEVKHLVKMATPGSKEARQLEKLKHTFEKVWNETKNTAQQPDGDETHKSDQGLAEAGSIKTQLRNNQDKLNEMNPFADIQVPRIFFTMKISEKQNWIIEVLRPTNYQVERNNFGIISFAKKHLKSAFNYYSKGSAEEVSFEALPKVLESGIEIANHTEHKGRGYGTVTIAAPIMINGKRGNMAVVVRQTDSNYYKVHRVLTPNGSVFQITDTVIEAEPTPAGESPQNGSLATPISSASTHNIPENAQHVNSKMSLGEDVNGTVAAGSNVYGADVALDSAEQDVQAAADGSGRVNLTQKATAERALDME